MHLSVAQPRTWGGKRSDAGRPRSRSGSWVAHVARPFHDKGEPVHVTLRTRRSVGHLRRFKLARAIGEAFRSAATSKKPADVTRRQSFRVVAFSLQPDHLHLMVEASSRVALSRGLGGLLSRLARAINRAAGRRGRVFLDRYHARALGSPTEVRRVLVYLLTNYKKHDDPIPDPECQARDGLDPCSSARWFDGWSRPPPPPAAPAPVVAPRTWLARRGWRHLGLVARREAPAAVVAQAIHACLPDEG